MDVTTVHLMTRDGTDPHPVLPSPQHLPGPLPHHPCHPPSRTRHPSRLLRGRLDRDMEATDHPVHPLVKPTQNTTSERKTLRQRTRARPTHRTDHTMTGSPSNPGRFTRKLRERSPCGPVHVAGATFNFSYPSNNPVRYSVSRVTNSRNQVLRGMRNEAPMLSSCRRALSVFDMHGVCQVR